ncbi:hypothetical protein J9253_05865 [Thiothrix litoralis]|jgi:hypothetical protein|uniref:Uncharacterized protein n=1 Tax=Thiothrix litoralis TaxID=2891210 RepID=A0ABX7WY97_9GAMM|nr:hypothetical protein [Thiothrix litoralis]QTR47458.1 hypothetical protein J9253_05865 [Thiothrix litoralis]
MGKVLFGDAAQTKLRADLYANEGLMIVAGTACFPTVKPDSGDYFFVAIVRPATGCNGVYKEIVKVVNTDGDKWGIQRVQDQCYRLAMDFRMGDMVYFEPNISQMIFNALSDGAKLGGREVAGGNSCEGMAFQQLTF